MEWKSKKQSSLFRFVYIFNHILADEKKTTIVILNPSGGLEQISVLKNLGTATAGESAAA